MNIKGSNHISQDICYCPEILGCDSTKLKEWKIRIKHQSGNYLEIFVYGMSAILIFKNYIKEILGIASYFCTPIGCWQ